MATLSDLQGSSWTGNAELWLDPLGNEAQTSECTISVEARALRYTWSYEGKSQAGSISLGEDGAEFTDTWHQPQPIKCVHVSNARGLFQIQYEYGPGSEWRWRIGASLRTSSDELVLQMTNITPWGEEARAVRMICRRQG